MHSGSLTLEGLSQLIPLQQMAAEFITPLGNTLATLESRYIGEELVTSCTGKCPPSLTGPMTQLDPVQARAMLCGTPALAESPFAELSNWHQDPKTQTLMWKGDVAFLEKRSAAKVFVETRTPDERHTRIRTEITPSWWSSTRLIVTWTPSSPPAEQSWLAPARIDFSRSQGDDGGQATWRLIIHDAELQSEPPGSRPTPTLP